MRQMNPQLSIISLMQTERQPYIYSYKLLIMNFGENELIDFFEIENRGQLEDDPSCSDKSEGEEIRRPTIGFSFLLDDHFNHFHTQPVNLRLKKEDSSLRFNYTTNYEQDSRADITRIKEETPLSSSRRGRVREDSMASGSRVKNETKNIPKNYGKAIIAFIEKNAEKCKEVLGHNADLYAELVDSLTLRKKNINTIQELRSLWIEGQFKLAREMRILSNLFLRKYALSYIYSSRITNYSSHVKYRHKLLEALKDPQNFINIKDY